MTDFNLCARIDVLASTIHSLLRRCDGYPPHRVRYQSSGVLSSIASERQCRRFYTGSNALGRVTLWSQDAPLDRRLNPTKVRGRKYLPRINHLTVRYLIRMFIGPRDSSAIFGVHRLRRTLMSGPCRSEESADGSSMVVGLVISVTTARYQ